jgi:hypothetical protein
MLGHIKHESINDRRLQQSCEQFISSGWWLKVTIPLPRSIVSLVLHSCAIWLGMSWLTCVHFGMQHTILYRWYIQINGANWHLWYWAASSDSRELWLCILVAAAWIVTCCECQLWHGMQVPRTVIGQTLQCEISQVIKCQMNELHGFLVSVFAAFQIGFVLKSLWHAWTHLVRDVGGYPMGFVGQLI